jgi:hypothetical protein
LISLSQAQGRFEILVGIQAADKYRHIAQDSWDLVAAGAGGRQANWG